MFYSLRRVMTIALLFFGLALTLAGCVHVDRSVQLHSDGSGIYTLNLGLRDEVVSAGGSGLQTQMAACGATVKSQGATFKTYQQDGYTIWSFTWSFPNVSALNTLLRSAPQGCDTSGSNVTASSNATDFFQVSRHSSGFTSSFHVTGQMSFALDSSLASGSANAQLLADARESFAITMPGGISSHTGGVVSGNTITYTVHVNQSAQIDATSNSLNVTALYPLIGGAVVILLLAGAMVWAYRRRSAPVTDDQQGMSSAEDSATPATPIATTTFADHAVSAAGYPHDAPTLAGHDDPPPTVTP